jgi:ABC-type xylose transport system permease subunit
LPVIPFLIRNPLLVFLALAATKHIRWRLVTRKRSVRRESAYMLMTIAIVLLVLYLLGLFAFHVTAGLIHIVLVIAVIMFILHFVTGRSA